MKSRTRFSHLVVLATVSIFWSASAEARFLQADPIGAAGGPNLYAYVGNDPLNRIDPSGLLTLTLGGNYSAYAGGGGEGSLGLAISFPVPYFDPGAKFDIGHYVSAGGGGGANIGGAVTLGAYKGDILTGGLRGTSANATVGAGPFGVTGSVDVQSRDFVGGNLSFGPRAPLPIFGSASITGTSVGSLRQSVTNLFQSVSDATNNSSSSGANVVAPISDRLSDLSGGSLSESTPPSKSH